MASAEKRLEELGIQLPDALPPVANYQMTKRHGDLVYVAGHVSKGADEVIAGKVGRDLTTEEGSQAARVTGLNLLASLRAELGSLDRVTSVLRIFVMVNGAEGYTDMPQVANGCSDLLVEVFGDDVGRHTRAAVSVANLPLGAAVEIDMVVAVDGSA